MKVYVIVCDNKDDFTRVICHVTADEEKAKLYCALRNGNRIFDEYTIECREMDDFIVEAPKTTNDIGYFYWIWFKNDLSIENCIYDDSRFNTEEVSIRFERPSKIVYRGYDKITNVIDYNIDVWLPDLDNKKAIEVARKLILEYKAMLN